MKEANPGATVYATNLRREWMDGRTAFTDRLIPTSYTGIHVFDVYIGWAMARERGLIVGTDGPLENNDIPDHVADIVYTIAPYPSSGGVNARQFGEDAARIASYASGTIVAITTGNISSVNNFVAGFQSRRPGSVFIEVDNRFGTPGDWGSEENAFTRMYVVP